MLYKVLVPFATLHQTFTVGNLVTNVDDAKNLEAAGIIELIPEIKADPEIVVEDEPKPITKNRGKK